MDRQRVAAWRWIPLQFILDDPGAIFAFTIPSASAAILGTDPK
jgi:hypothetical protein